MARALIAELWALVLVNERISIRDMPSSPVPGSGPMDPCTGGVHTSRNKVMPMAWSSPPEIKASSPALWSTQEASRPFTPD